MIPKIIHYCWLSGEQMPQRLKNCIESWKLLMPEYEIMLWDTNRFDIHSVKWVEQAYSVKKWAFAADYIRLYALYHYGGIYLDSDVRVLKSFDPFLEHRGFSSAEFWEVAYNPEDTSEEIAGIAIEAAIMGSEARHPLIKAFMDHYQNRDFILQDGYDNRVMTYVIKDIAKNFGFIQNHLIHQVLDDDFHIYPYDYFTTQDSRSGNDMLVTHNTVAIHLCSGSWVDLVPVLPRHHSRYTYWRLATKEYFKKIWREVILHRRP